MLKLIKDLLIGGIVRNYTTDDENN